MRKLAAWHIKGQDLAEWKRAIKLARLMLSSPLRATPGEPMSPITGKRDLAWALSSQAPVTGIDLQTDEQVLLMRQLANYWSDGVPDQPVPDWRYRSSKMFQPADANLYFAMLQHLRPKRLIEVGSGFTSALALDVRDRHLRELELTFIEPQPHRLNRLLKEGDGLNCEVIAEPIQEVSLKIFERLTSGDLLFIDTSHIAKAGSEVNWLVFNVLPRIARGVIVQIHDIFWPFEYPRTWLEDGFSYTELYLLRAFLMFNTDFRILLFSHWMWEFHRELFTALPANYTGGPPGSLWLQRVQV